MDFNRAALDIDSRSISVNRPEALAFIFTSMHHRLTLTMHHRLTLKRCHTHTRPKTGRISPNFGLNNFVNL